MSRVPCLDGLHHYELNSNVIYFLFYAASELKWPESKGQRSRLGLVLLALTAYCNSVFPDEMSCMALLLEHLSASFNFPAI